MRVSLSSAHRPRADTEAARPPAALLSRCAKILESIRFATRRNQLMTRKRAQRSPLERKATQHHDFVGEAAPERAQAEKTKHEHVEAARDQDVVREMADRVEQEAERPELRIPRSVKEGKRLFARGPELLREKAQERLAALPKQAHVALELVQVAASLVLVPVRMGTRLVRSAVQFPSALFHALRRQEA
jgi:hypothetical protein